ncbi:hypothetical protein D8B26_002036 [Coccidioides posadasii str. Silveira]|uniref:Uncharacterized protein n=1 Tax=Coccidioides posadasii (strain RMSCC 757 / Silveira) TaxID=443226 RepID=E9CXA3_COCPS|nr:conserved hypothetical protein [Coccidioides posadasii str. Silveira]QVM07335.1 hypothetical protein D8B26_002036 [Coccidioides posadasii str. Silveira]
MGPVEFTPWHRNDIRALNDVKQTFSSWDSCMAKPYCKWPAIVGIVVGSLVVIGIAWCIISCLCCGYTCCKGCCSCCSCCGDGGGSSGGQRSKYADPPAAYPPPPAPNYGYQPSAPPVYDNPPPPTKNWSPVAQHAQFDVPTQKAVNEDALPHMPSWANATTRRVEDTSQDVEMNQLSPATGQAIGTAGRNHSGYYEVPSQPTSPHFAPDNAYRGTELAGTPASPSNIGIAQTQGFSNQPYRDRSPVHSTGGMFVDTTHPYSRSPNASPPPVQNAYAPYSPHGQQQSGYAAYSPSIPSSPPPPFSSTYGDNNNGRQTPTLLQAGRKPVENSWKDV